MTKKALFISLIITVFSVVLAYLSIQNQNTEQRKNNVIGNYTFEGTNKEGIDINKIVIKMSDLQVSLYYENKFWHIKEADGYYADLITINQLFQEINQSKIEAIAADISSEEAGTTEENESEAIKIQTYNQKGQLVDSVIIGKKKNSFLYAQYENQQQIYLISGSFNLPDKLKYWLQQPLISLSPENVESVIIQNSTGQQVAYRLNRQSPFYNLKQQTTNVLPLLDKFVLLGFTDVKQIKNTPLDSLSPNRTIALFPYSGLIYGMEIYKIENDYWLKIDLSITKLPTKLASDYIKDSAFLYQGWAFKIDKDLGQYLLNYKIN